MSCIPLTPDHRQVLDLLAQAQPVPDNLDTVLDELVRWGWVMPSGELTGVGRAHVGEGTGGRVGIHDHPHGRNP